jgi:lambda family phage portal protein
VPTTSLDRAIGWFSPKWGAERSLNRMRLDQASALKRRYEAVTAGRSDGWVITGGDANSQVLSAACRVREAAHDLVRNNPWAIKGVNTWRTSAGPIALRSQLPGTQGARPRVRGGPTDRIDTMWWEHWQAVCAAGGETYDDTQVTGIGTLVESGEYLLRRIDEPMASGLPVPMSLQLLEPDYLDEGRDRALDDGGLIIGGIQFDRRGRRVGYWLFREHPSAYRAFTKRLAESVFVPADEIAHVYEKMRPGQVRGISWFAPAVLRLHDLDQYDSYELIRKKAEACLVAVVTGGDPGETLGASPTDGAGRPLMTDGYGTRIESLDPGMVVYTQADVKFNDSKTSSDTGFTRQQLLACAAALGLTYERLTGDLSQVSFISGRMGEIQFRPRVRQVQQATIIPRHCQRVWSWWTRAAFAAGLLDTPNMWARYTAPPWESIQPLDDATAALLQARMGLRTMPSLIAETGEDWLEQVDEIKQWNAELDDGEIVLDSDPRHATKAGQVQQAPGAAPVTSPLAGATPIRPPQAANARANGHGQDGLVTEVLKLANGSRARENPHGH